MKVFYPLYLALVLAVVSTGCDTVDEEDVDLPVPREVDEADYVTTESGLKYYDFVVGEGTEADSGSTIVAHYNLWLEDGTLIQSSYLSGFPITFELGTGDVIKGWDEGVTEMKEGGDRQLVIPPELAWDSTGVPQVGIPPNATVLFEVGLLDVNPD